MRQVKLCSSRRPGNEIVGRVEIHLYEQVDELRGAVMLRHQVEGYWECVTTLSVERENVRRFTGVLHGICAPRAFCRLEAFLLVYKYDEQGRRYSQHLAVISEGIFNTWGRQDGHNEPKTVPYERFIDRTPLPALSQRKYFPKPDPMRGVQRRKLMEQGLPVPPVEEEPEPEEKVWEEPAVTELERRLHFVPEPSMGPKPRLSVGIPVFEDKTLEECKELIEEKWEAGEEDMARAMHYVLNHPVMPHEDDDFPHYLDQWMSAYIKWKPARTIHPSNGVNELPPVCGNHHDRRSKRFNKPVKLSFLGFEQVMRQRFDIDPDEDIPMLRRNNPAKPRQDDADEEPSGKEEN